MKPGAAEGASLGFECVVSAIFHCSSRLHLQCTALPPVWCMATRAARHVGHVMHAMATGALSGITRSHIAPGIGTVLGYMYITCI